MLKWKMDYCSRAHAARYRRRLVLLRWPGRRSARDASRRRKRRLGSLTPIEWFFAFRNLLRNPRISHARRAGRIQHEIPKWILMVMMSNYLSRDLYDMIWYHGIRPGDTLMMSSVPVAINNFAGIDIIVQYHYNTYIVLLIIHIWYVNINIID